MTLPGSQEPPTLADGLDFHPRNVYDLGPGIQGFAVEHAGRIYIPILIGISPGRGDCGRFLDSLSPRCVIVSVVDDRLREMLSRRGWAKCSDIRVPGLAAALDRWPAEYREFVQQLGGSLTDRVDGYVHPAAGRP